MDETIYIYCQGTTMAGHQAHIDAEEAAQTDDVVEVEASQAEADEYRRLAETAGAGTDLYYLQVAETIERHIA